MRGDALAQTVPRGQPVGDGEWCEGEGDEGGHAVPDCETERGLWTDLLHGADEHAAAAGHGVLHLAAGGDDVEDLGADRFAVDPAVVGVLLGELPVGRGIEVERLDGDAHLVRPEGRVGVDDAGGLREGARGFDHPVDADG